MFHWTILCFSIYVTAVTGILVSDELLDILLRELQKSPKLPKYDEVKLQKFNFWITNRGFWNTLFMFRQGTGKNLSQVTRAGPCKHSEDHKSYISCKLINTHFRVEVGGSAYVKTMFDLEPIETWTSPIVPLPNIELQMRRGTSSKTNKKFTFKFINGTVGSYLKYGHVYLGKGGIKEFEDTVNNHVIGQLNDVLNDVYSPILESLVIENLSKFSGLDVF